MAQKHSYEKINHMIENLKSRVLCAKESDVFSREDVKDLIEAHDMLSNRLNRIVKISDGYQYELKNTTKSLQEALSKVKVLSGLIPICASCKRVRSGEGYWKQVEQYIIENSEADITHGLCPECAANYMHMLKDEDETHVKKHKEASSAIGLSDEDLSQPVVSQYLGIINNKHFAKTPLYDELTQLLQKYIRLEKRMRRIVRISDNYQTELHEIREKFEQESKLDYLTGLCNRREMYRLMEMEINRIDRNEGTFALIMLDFDRFKSVNDQFGHAVGDHILQMGAKRIQDILRKQDVCARWGGEEFMIIQPGSCPDGVRQCSERLRHVMAQAPLQIGERKIDITISLGVALYRKGEKPEDCIKRADNSLYAAKKAGRNLTGPLE